MMTHIIEATVSLEEINEYHGCVITGYTRRVYHYLKNLPVGHAHPKQCVMATDLGCTRRTVERAVATLKRLGIILVKRIFPSKPGGWINCYDIVKKLVRKAPMSDRMSDSYKEEIGNRHKKRKLSTINPEFSPGEDVKALCQAHSLNVCKEKERFLLHHERHRRLFWDTGEAFMGWVRNKIQMVGKKSTTVYNKCSKQPEGRKQIVKTIEETRAYLDAQARLPVSKPEVAREWLRRIREDLRRAGADTRKSPDKGSHGQE